MSETKIVISEIEYGNQHIQKLTEQMIELLTCSRYALISHDDKQAVDLFTGTSGGQER